MKTRAAIVKAAHAAGPAQRAVFRSGFASRGERAA
ncbi:MAG: hypothetical protein JWO21_1363 [Solirubrobacterales bacterium]|nr:hypothetical protein [Solirubrobacterales bacterium]